jgi:hypothetical protein
MLSVEENKRYHISRNRIPVSERIEAFYADEMRKIWISDLSRNWELFSRRVMEEAF